jgi:hypothetical protein
MFAGRGALVPVPAMNWLRLTRLFIGCARRKLEIPKRGGRGATALSRSMKTSSQESVGHRYISNGGRKVSPLRRIT